MAHRFSVVIHAYSVRFNRRHRRSGHLFQGRFKARLVEEEGASRAISSFVEQTWIDACTGSFSEGQRARRAAGMLTASGPAHTLDALEPEGFLLLWNEASRSEDRSDDAD